MAIVPSDWEVGRSLVTRRDLGAGVMAGVGSLALPRAAQSQPSPATAFASLVIEGTGAPAGSVATFGMAFGQGDLPSGASLVVRHAGGVLPTQCTVLKPHVDGSARHAFVAVEVPALPEGRLLEAGLAAAPTVDTAPALARDVFAGRRAVLTLRPVGGGAPFVFDLIAAVPQERWVHGPLATQARVQANVPRVAAGGVESLRVFADLTMLKDGTLWIDLALRNDIGFRRSSGTARYAVSLEQDGMTVFEHEEVVHPLFRNLMRVTLPGTLPGGRRAAVRPHLRHDVRYLAETARVVPNVDRQLGVDAQRNRAVRAMLTEPNWNVPFDGRGLATSWGAAGVPDFIGPISGIGMGWLITGGRDWQAVALGQSEALASAPLHVWDPEGGAARRGAWVNAIDRPRLWLDWRDPNFRPTSDNTGARHEWRVGSLSHMPSCHYVPYLLTAKRAILDAQLAQSAYTLMAFAIRGPGWNPQTGEGMNVSRGEQWRTMGWSLRELLNAAYLSPADQEPYPDYFHAACVGNFNWFNRQTPAYEVASGELRGHLRDAYGLGKATDDYSYHTEYMVSSFIKAVWFGIPGARRFLEWQLNWLAGRFLNEPAFYPSNLVRLSLAFPYFRVTSWSQLGEVNKVFGPLPVANWNANGSAAFDCMPLIAMNIAGLVDIFPQDPRLARAWRWFFRPNVPQVEAMQVAAFLSYSSKRSVVPMRRTRAPVPPAVHPNQVFRPPRGASAGAVVGVLQTFGGVATAYAVTGGPPGTVTVDDAGVLTFTGALPSGRHVFQASASNAHGRSRDVAFVVEIG